MAVELGTSSGFVTVTPTVDPAGTGVTIDGSKVVTKDTSPSNAARITEVGWYRGSGTNGANWEIGLYDESGGVANALLFVDATNSSTSAGWLSVAVDWAISPSTAYWLGLQMDTHTGASTVDSATAGGAGIDVATGAASLTDPFGGGAVSDADGMYAIYALWESSGDTYTKTGFSDVGGFAAGLDAVELSRAGFALVGALGAGLGALAGNTYTASGTGIIG